VRAGPENEPNDGGRLHWDTAGGVVTPTLSGRLFMNNVDGLRGRLRIDYYDAAQPDHAQAQHLADCGRRLQRL